MLSCPEILLQPVLPGARGQGVVAGPARFPLLPAPLGLPQLRLPDAAARRPALPPRAADNFLARKFRQRCAPQMPWLRQRRPPAINPNDLRLTSRQGRLQLNFREGCKAMRTEFPAPGCPCVISI